MRLLCQLALVFWACDVALATPPIFKGCEEHQAGNAPAGPNALASLAVMTLVTELMGGRDVTLFDRQGVRIGLVAKAHWNFDGLDLVSFLESTLCRWRPNNVELAGMTRLLDLLRMGIGTTSRDLLNDLRNLSAREQVEYYIRHLRSGVAMNVYHASLAGALLGGSKVTFRARTHVIHVVMGSQLVLKTSL